MAMKEYYSRRAPEYEGIYHRDDPVRQQEQEWIKSELQAVFKGRSVLEIACGTGYWTETIAAVARETTGIDASAEVLEIAKAKGMPARFIMGDAFALSAVAGNFDAACACFWLSHVEKANIGKFLLGLHARVGPGAPIFMADNVYLEGLGGTLITKPGSPDTYKLRQLKDGTAHEIVKNYYTADELKNVFKDFADELRIEIGQCFWRIKYKTKKLMTG
jgi:2-polyprenyl-3-methyl-5-hydroxy-6-metoxy-1,4-benzoquinol methylase